MAYLFEAIDKIGKVVGSGKKILDTVQALNGLGGGDGSAAGSAAKATAQALSTQHSERIRSLIEQQLSELRVKEALKAQLARAETELLEITSQFEQKSLLMAGALSAVSLYTLYLYYCSRSNARTIEQMRAERLEVERNFHVKSLTFHQQKLDLCFWLLRHRDSSDPAIRNYVVRMLENGHMGRHPAATLVEAPQRRRLLEGATPSSPTLSSTSSITTAEAADAATLTSSNDDDGDDTSSEVEVATPSPPSSSSATSIAQRTVASLIAALRSPTTTPSRRKKEGVDDEEVNLDDESGLAVNFGDDDADFASLPFPSAADFDSLPLPPIPLADLSLDGEVPKNSSERTEDSSELDLSDSSSSTGCTPFDTSSSSESVSSDTHTEHDTSSLSEEPTSDSSSTAFDAFQSASVLAEAFSGTPSHFHTTQKKDSAEFQPSSTSLGSYDHMTFMCSDFSSRE